MKLLIEIREILLKKEQGNASLSRYLVRGTAGTLFIQGISVLLMLLSNFILAKICGAAEYGTFTYLFTCVTVGANIALLGFNTLLIRQVSVYKDKGRWNFLKGLMNLSSYSVLITSLLLGLIFISLFQSFDFFSRIGNVYLFAISMIALPVVVMMMLFQSILQGFQKVLSGQVPEKIIRPMVFILLMLVIYFSRTGQIPVVTLVWINILSFIVALVWVAKSTDKAISPFIKQVTASYETAKWVKSTSYFFLLGAIQILNARSDILILGAWKGSSAAGVYNIAVRLSDFMTLSLLVINTVIAPSISNLYYSQQESKLQKTVTIGARAALFLSMPVLLVLILGGRWILGYLGDSFTSAYIPMLIITAAQFINVLSGSVGNILIMTGNEKSALISLLTGSIVTVILNILLIPSWGMNGTAAAVAAGIITWNVLMFFFVKTKTRINPTAFARLQR